MAESSETSNKCCCKYCCFNKPRKDCCFSSLTQYCELALTTDTRQVFGTLPAGEKEDPCCNICLCITCMPLRFAMTIPWFFGATINSCIGTCTKKEKNYLC
jgi:hypothetical protein